MLILSRKVNDQIVLDVRGVQIVITMTLTAPHLCKLGFQAPREVSIVRPDAKSKERK